MPRSGQARVSGAVVAATVLMTCGTGLASDPRVDPQAVAVNIQRTPAQPWPGYGVYLGDGLVVTAAHVAGRDIVNHSRVVVAGQPLPTMTVKEGSYPDNDLTLLRIKPPLPPTLADLHVTLCPGPPRPGEAVKVATPEKVTASTIIAPEVLPADMRSRFSASIKDVYTTGNSGSGVFDAATWCLLGIMSAKIETQQTTLVNGVPTTRTIGLAKHFVPSEDIRSFLADVPKP